MWNAYMFQAKYFKLFNCLIVKLFNCLNCEFSSFLSYSYHHQDADLND